MNIKGAGMFLAVVFAVIFFLFGIVFINFIQPLVRDTQTNLDCTNAAGISDGVKLTCIANDGIVPYFIVLVVTAAGGVIMARLAI